jgi:hypothetical protein
LHHGFFSSPNLVCMRQTEPAPMTTQLVRSVHRMGWMIRLFTLH